MGWLSHGLDKAGFDTRPLGFDSMSDPPAAHIERLAQAVKDSGADTIHLLGHSLGGVVVLHYLQSAVDKRLGRALLLGTPALGSQAALQLDRQPWGALLGASRELWLTPFPTAIKAKIPVGAIAGDHSFGLGPLFVSLAGANDGVVSVSETRIAGLKDHLVLPVSHTGMLLSSEVCEQAAAFLNKGSFER